MTLPTNTSDEQGHKPKPGDEDGGFEGLLQATRDHFARAANAGGPLFRTDAPVLQAIFIEHLPEALRRHYTCSACRHFFRRFGGLVTVDAEGGLVPALWPAPEAVPGAFAGAMAALRRVVADAAITGVFVSPEAALGTPSTGEWTHLSVTLPDALVYRGLVKSAGQHGAEKREDVQLLRRGLDAFSPEVVKQALTYLTTGGFYRAEKGEAALRWLLELHELRARARDERARDNLFWVAAATAPAGFSHFRTGVVGTLLEDIAEGKPVDVVKARWEDKLSADSYMRPQAAPAAGNIAQAEKIVAALAAAGALERRYARLAELEGFVWQPPRPTAAASGGVFGHLTPKAKASPQRPVLPQQTMTWEKFQRTVLPAARSLEVLAPTSPDRFVALVTAARPDAPPILQWDSAERRNPVSWYYAAGIDAEIRRRVLQAGGTHEGCDIRASLLWNNRNDLDLHVITPAGEHIFFATRKDSSGGWLDVDMNVRGETTTPVENIRWTRGQAPPGVYRVYVQNYRFHEPLQAPTPFRVELEVNGEVFQHDGVISSSRQVGDSSNVTVAEFSYAQGQKLGAPPAGLRVPKPSGSWNVTPGQWVKVTGVLPSPNLWGERPLLQHGRHVFFLLEGCRDTASGVGRGFFVETLRSEFHPIRATLEAYAASAVIADAEQADACGVGMNDQSPWNLTVRVGSDDAQATYLIDRWD